MTEQEPENALRECKRALEIHIAGCLGQRTRRTVSCCPFCQSEIQADTPGTRYYDCGTRVNRKGAVQYEKRCR